MAFSRNKMMVIRNKICIAVVCAVAVAMGWVEAIAGSQVAPTAAQEAPVATQYAGCVTPAVKGRRSFEVGPGQKYEDLTKVPWLSLRAGDVVNIYYRPEPYRTKIGLRAQGTAQAPVIINGVTDASCHRPIIDGTNAVTAIDAIKQEFFSAQYSEFLGTIFLYKAPSDPWGYKPRFIQIKNLLITGANARNTYTSQSGATVHYGFGAAGIYAVVVEDLLVENCEITGNGNGVFVNTKDDTEEEASYRVVLRRNKIHLNGNPGRWFEHNIYVQAVRPVYEGNYIGQLVPGAVGSSLKDRSSGTIIRFNHIVAAARALDLVETEGGGTSVLVDPLYNDAWVYGNIIVSDYDNPGVSSQVVIHWGGDNNPKNFRSGILHFYYNTVITRASSAQTYRLHVFDLPSNLQQVEMRSNIFAHFGTAVFEIGDKAGTLVFADTNWITKGWLPGYETGNSVTVKQEGTLIEGAEPGLKPNFDPAPGSAVIDKGAAAPSALSHLWIDQQYAAVASLLPRKTEGRANDLGAREVSSQ